MCKYCDEVYIYKNVDIALNRYKYRIEYKDGKFNTIEDDEVYELQNITHCPWCGRELEKPKEEKPFAITKEQYEKLSMVVANEHSRINRICIALDVFLASPAAWGLGKTSREQLQRSLRKIRDDN